MRGKEKQVWYGCVPALDVAAWSGLSFVTGEPRLRYLLYYTLQTFHIHTTKQHSTHIKPQHPLSETREFNLVAAPALSQTVLIRRRQEPQG